MCCIRVDEKYNHGFLTSFQTTGAWTEQGLPEVEGDLE